MLNRDAFPDPRRVAVLCGVIFVPAGLVKFGFYHWELHAFRDFGSPATSVMEPLVGVLEIIGGCLLIGDMLVAPTAFVLAVIMTVAFIAGGIIHGSPIPSDTLAPTLLVAMAYLIAAARRAPSTPSGRRDQAPPSATSGRRRGSPNSWERVR